jgi:SAM-dependent methyltransferase
MPKIDTDKFYTSAIQKYGTTAQGVNWASKENQLLRFKEILALLPKDISTTTLADAGCGFGDFYHYLLKKKRAPLHYIGLDYHLDMCSIAEQQTAQEIINADICKDTLPTCDYYICSGALNVLTVFETHLFIKNCYNASKKAFIFNALYGNKKSETYNYLTKEKINSIAKELDVKEILFQTGYLENDITVSFIR